jgi:hypothetical protein
MVPWFSSDSSGKKTRLPRPGPANVPLVERRTGTRFDINFGAFFHPLPGNEQFYSARIKNLSRGGIALIANRPFEAATRFVILLSKPAEVRLIHTTSTPQGHWLLGCVFTKELSEEDLSVMLAKHEKANSSLA